MNPVRPKQYIGSLVLCDLPASPADAFQNATLTYQANQLSITILAPEKFACSPYSALDLHAENFSYFKDLALTFTQGIGENSLRVQGSVTAVVLDAEIPLTVGLGEDGRLAFSIAPPALPAIAIGNWGFLDVTSLRLKPSTTSTEGLQALYSFDEGQGSVVYDCSGAEQPIDLRVQTAPTTVRWDTGYLSFNENALVSSGIAARSPSAGAVAAVSSAKRVIDACRTSQKVSIVAWLRSKQMTFPDAPARIVTLSKDISNRCFALSLDKGNGNPTTRRDRYIVRFRTQETNANGEPSLETEPSLVSNNLVCLTYTFEPQKENNREQNAKFYVNGFLKEDRAVGGNLDWPQNDAAYALGLGNEVSYSPESRANDKHNRPWQGDLYRVAIFSRALPPEEIYQQYYPILEIKGQFRLKNAPAPLNLPFLATLKMEQVGSNHLELSLRDAGNWSVADQLQFTAIQMVLRRPLPNSIDPPIDWVLASGSVEGLLWGNALTFGMYGSVNGNGVNLSLVTPASGSTEVNLRLEGLNTLVFSQIELQSQRTLEGSIWQLNSTTDMTEVMLPRLRDGRPFDFNTDFKLRLTPPVLGFKLIDDKQRVVLNGRWLDQPLALYNQDPRRGMVLHDAIAFQLPFRLPLGLIRDPETGAPLINSVTLDSELTATVALELTSLGFLAYISGSFSWSAVKPSLTFTIPPFPVVKPPFTPNQILDLLLDKLKAEAGTIFASTFRHPEDYFFTVVGDRPLLYLGGNSSPSSSSQTTTLPNLFSSPEDISFGTFSLKHDSDTESYILTLNPGSLSPGELKANYQTFLEKVEERSLYPGALTLVKARIAERLPLPLDQLLYYYYGFEPDKNIIDLHGGMRLRVDYQTYQFVHPASPSASSGFVGSGTTYYHLNSYRRNGPIPFLGLDAFLSALSLTTQPNQELGFGGGIDLFRVGYRMPYGRLVYPRQVAGNEGLPNGERTTALIGAKSLVDLNQATQRLLSTGRLESTNDYLSVFFRGRATVIPEIAVFVQGQPEYVPVGTTLRQVLERYASVPMGLPGQTLTLQMGTPRISRLIHEGIDDAPSYRFVNLSNAQATAIGWDPYDLPVVKGDRIFL
ncbi:MAG: LamG-like jellyroll fold domain-containing protein [Oculatellaceae cyanobacterium bins.114]|nr:LamG-like jellyroll fold domain-containing protein [Oculatellaceae cyanobacterium bins.114]